MIRFGTLGAARITPNALIYPCMNEPQAMISCVAARDRARAEAFAEAHHIRTVLDTYDEVATHEKITALYNPLHIPAHHKWTIMALNAGKHVLCEKSLACNATEAAEMRDVARAQNLVLMDAYHYRYHPVFIRAKEIYDSGVLGDIETIATTFQIEVTDETDIRMNYELGGGVTMDIGCYPISWVRHISGLEPDRVQASAEVGPPNVDVFLETRMELPGGIVATTTGDMREGVPFRADIVVTGSKGKLTINNPIAPQMGHLITLEQNGSTQSEELDRRPTYAYQLDAFINAVQHGASLFTDGDDAVKQMQVIDRAYEAAGLPLRGLDI